VPDLAQEESSTFKGLRPRSLIVTIYGLYAREAGGWLSVSTLIKMMAAFGIEPQAVRSSIARLKRREILDATKLGGAAGYALSPHGREILQRGDRRIFERPRATTADGWVLVVFTGIPESEREKRYQLRASLSWLGFGTVANGVWIAPAHVADEARNVLRDSNLTEYVDLFRVDHFAFQSLAGNVATWWDIAELDRMYGEFVGLYRPTVTQWRRLRRYDDAAAFVDYVEVLTHWRRLPYLDPGLPAELLPREWSGSQAADMFFELSRRLAPAARRYAKLVAGTEIAKVDSP